MYLTRFHFSARSQSGQKYLRNPGRIHAAVYKSLPDPVCIDGKSRPLWRVDLNDPAKPVLWVVSGDKPNLDELAKEAGRIVDGRAYETRSYTTLLDQLAEGQRYAFRFAGNPVHSARKSPESEKTQRFGHVTVAQQTEWFCRRAEVNGFKFVEDAAGELAIGVVGRRREVFFGSEEKGRHRVVISVAEFAGQLEVTDVELFRNALTTGIGHARAYGCGLLTVAPAPQ